MLDPGQVLSSYSVASLARTVSLCSPLGGRWIGHWRTTWSPVCSSAPHWQAAEEAIPHFYICTSRSDISDRLMSWYTTAISARFLILFRNLVRFNSCCEFSICAWVRLLLQNVFGPKICIFILCKYSEKKVKLSKISAVARQPRTPRSGGRPFVGSPTMYIVLVS